MGLTREGVAGVKTRPVAANPLLIPQRLDESLALSVAALIHDGQREIATLGLANLRRLAPKALIFETSAKTGQGMDAWREFLVQQQQERKSLDPLA